jgi:hypothetical protein
MSKIHSEATEIIDARPEVIYGIISDYRVGHPAILPRPPFGELIVEEGGKGAGTVMRFDMKVWGRKTSYHQRVSEPEPGQLLVEAEIEDSDLVTTFRLEPLDGGARTRVTITTDVSASPGFTGFMEKLFQPSIIRGIYKKELRQLADYARTQHPAVNIG